VVVAQVCYRLDGIPLDLELAAARAKVLSAEQIASRLDERFGLLSGWGRTALPHQRTLRAKEQRDDEDTRDADRGGIPTTGTLEQGQRKGGQATDDAPVAHEASRPPSRFLVALGAAGPVLFFAVATLVGLLRPGYDATSRPVSELALGPFG
jgi:hypothetical protein